VEENEKDPNGEAPVGAAAAAGAAAAGAAAPPAAGVDAKEKEPKGEAAVVAGAAAEVVPAGADENENDPKADPELAAAGAVDAKPDVAGLSPPLAKENAPKGAGADVAVEPVAGVDAAAGAGVVDAAVDAAGFSGAVAVVVDGNVKEGAAAAEEAAAAGADEKEKAGADDDDVEGVEVSADDVDAVVALEREEADGAARLKVAGVSSALLKSDLATGDLASSVRCKLGNRMVIDEKLLKAFDQLIGSVRLGVPPTPSVGSLLAGSASAVPLAVAGLLLVVPEVMGATEGPNENSPGGRTSAVTDAKGLGSGLKSNSESFVMWNAHVS
jgi:hypothetical protein